MNNSTVNLYKDSGYWKLKYYDGSGKRRSKSLGSVKGTSKRQAMVKAQRFIGELTVNPGQSARARAPRLGEYVAQYLKSRTDIQPSTRKEHEMCCRYLVHFFGQDRRIDLITRAMAAEW